MISGGTSQDMSLQTAAVVKNMGAEQRKNILKCMNHKTIVPAEHIASMKATLNLPWNQLREISRWLNTFDIKISSEKKSRQITNDWVGEGLNVEEAPLTKLSLAGKRTEIIFRPWAYLYNVVGYIINRLQSLSDCNQLVSHPFIEPDTIHIKIGGDHGDTSFKMGFQIGNVVNPNRKDNTVIFSIFEGKDTRSNLRTCLARYRPQISMLQNVKFQNKTIKVFMYGDYEFLCTMYGLTGANGEYIFIYFYNTKFIFPQLKILNRNYICVYLLYACYRTT